MDDNREIITALIKGDKVVFNRIYRDYFRRLCGFCSQYVKDIEESQEIVQDTMFWLWTNRTSLIADLSLKSLLFTIVRNKALNRISHNEVKRKVLDEIVAKYEGEFSNPDFYFSELLTVYKNALNNLPDDYRQAFLLNREQRMTHNEIAKMLNVSPQTVNYRIGRALKMLRDALKDYLPLCVILLILEK